jgi:hypothetical protein
LKNWKFLLKADILNTGKENFTDRLFGTFDGITFCNEKKFIKIGNGQKI